MSLVVQQDCSEADDDLCRLYEDKYTLDEESPRGNVQWNVISTVVAHSSFGLTLALKMVVSRVLVDSQAREALLFDRYDVEVDEARAREEFWIAREEKVVEEARQRETMQEEATKERQDWFTARFESLKEVIVAYFGYTFNFKDISAPSDPFNPIFPMPS